MGKSKKINFTAGRISEFGCPDGTGQAFIWDSAVPGLGVRATKGAKTYIFQARLPDKSSFRLTLGKTGALTLDAARRIAQEVAAKVAQGIDPREEKKDVAAEMKARRAAEKQRAVTFGEAWCEYVESSSHKWSDRHLRDNRRVVDPGGRPARRRGAGETIQPGLLFGFTSIRLSDLTREDVIDWLKTETARRPTQAALSFRLLRAFVNWATRRYQVHEGVCSGCGEFLQKPSARNDCLQREQLRGWFKFVGMLDRITGAYLQALLLTGARRNEIAGLRWSDIDFRWKAIRIHDKVDGERTIPLTPHIAAMLQVLPRRNDFVFSSENSKSGHIEDVRRGHARACDAAGIEGLTLHGLRRSFGTLSEWVEAPIGVVAQIMGHKPSAIAERHYRKRPIDLLRMWHIKIEGWILEQAGIKQPKEADDAIRLVK